MCFPNIKSSINLQMLLIIEAGPFQPYSSACHWLADPADADMFIACMFVKQIRALVDYRTLHNMFSNLGISVCVC
eukprot:c2655_g1_i1 orf=1-222(-)